MSTSNTRIDPSQTAEGSATGTLSPRMLKYQRLRGYLMDGLAQGRLKPGHALPSEEGLAQTLQVARKTIRRGLAELERDGLIRRVQGSGTFVTEQAAESPDNGPQTATNVFGIIVPAMQSGFCLSLLRGFEQASRQVHNQVLVCNSDNDIERQGNAILQILERRADGLAIFPADKKISPAFQARLIRQLGVPLVFCHRRVGGIQAPLVRISYRAVGTMAGEAFLKRGHRRVAMFRGHASRAGEIFEKSLRDVMLAGSGDLPEEFVYIGRCESLDAADQTDAIRETLHEMFQRPNRPTGIMATFDSLAEVIYLLLGEMGLRVPEDVSLISFGDKKREGSIVRRLTSVISDEAEIGQRAAMILAEMRDGNRPLDDNEDIRMPLRLSEGETLAPPSEKQVNLGQ